MVFHERIHQQAGQSAQAYPQQRQAGSYNESDSAEDAGCDDDYGYDHDFPWCEHPAGEGGGSEGVLGVHSLAEVEPVAPGVAGRVQDHHKHQCGYCGPEHEVLCCPGPVFPVHVGGADYYWYRRSREGPGPYRNHPFPEGMLSHIVISVFRRQK